MVQNYIVSSSYEETQKHRILTMYSKFVHSVIQDNNVVKNVKKINKEKLGKFKGADDEFVYYIK